MTRLRNQGRTNRMTKFAEVTPDLTWEVEEHAVHAKGIIHEDYKALMRDDNAHLINIVKKGYNVFTNDKLKEVVGQMQKFGGFELEGYSQWDKGGKVFAFLKNKENVRFIDWDAHEYMIIGNSHDSSMSFFTGGSSTIVRCKNSFSQIHQYARVKHNSFMADKVNEIIHMYENYCQEQTQLKETFERWSGMTVTKEQKDYIANEIFKPKEGEKLSVAMTNKRGALTLSIIEECNAMGDNMFGLFNGVTHYTTHKSTREMSFGNSFGYSAAINKRAFELVEGLN